MENNSVLLEKDVTRPQLQAHKILKKLGNNVI